MCRYVHDLDTHKVFDPWSLPGHNTMSENSIPRSLLIRAIHYPVQSMDIESYLCIVLLFSRWCVYTFLLAKNEKILILANRIGNINTYC